MELDRFRRTHPSDPVTAYAMWLVSFNWHVQECRKLASGEWQ